VCALGRGPAGYRAAMREIGEWRSLGVKPPVGDFFEDVISGIILEFVNSGQLVVDGGAHQGLHTLPMSVRVGRFGKVHAVEANPYFADGINRAIESLGLLNVQLHRVAVGHESGSAQFTFALEEPGKSGLRKRPDLLDKFKIQELTVPVVRLDELLSSRSAPVAFMKFDLEGGELNALRGAREILLEDQPLVVFEDGRKFSGDLYDYTDADFYSFFDDIGYEVLDLFGQSRTPGDWFEPPNPWCSVAVSRSAQVPQLGERLAAICRQFAGLHAKNTEVSNTPLSSPFKPG
jgi:FkbM family methyltransferase